MRGRKPTKAEKIYIERSKSAVGCVACSLLGYDNDSPEEYLAFHHNPEVGSLVPFAHYFGYPLCPIHHQGAVPTGCKLPENEPVRHPPLGGNNGFTEQLGTDLDLARYTWTLLPSDVIEEIGRITGVYSFDELLQISEKYDQYLSNS